MKPTMSSFISKLIFLLKNSFILFVCFYQGSWIRNSLERIQAWAIRLTWTCREITSLTTEANTTCGPPHGSCLIKHSITCRAISDGKWRPHLKLLGASDKQNVIIWTEIQLMSLTTKTRGSLRIRCSILGQCLWLQLSLLSVSSSPRWTEHLTLSTQHHLIHLPILASTEEAKFMLTE